jgi:F-type H+-transporting ATPase subunit delta
MASASKQSQQLARQLFALSVSNGVVSPERVGGVLEYLEKHPPAQPLTVLKAYRRLVATELARSEARVEHAGPVSAAALAAIEATMSKKYGRTIKAVAQPKPTLIAGFNVRVGDDVYQSSIASQLAGLAVSV